MVTQTNVKNPTEDEDIKNKLKLLLALKELEVVDCKETASGDLEITFKREGKVFKMYIQGTVELKDEKGEVVFERHFSSSPSISTSSGWYTSTEYLGTSATRV